MADTTVRCKDCGRMLDERSDLAASDRLPCPDCGSLARAFEVVVHGSMALETDTAGPGSVVLSPPMLTGKGEMLPPSVTGTAANVLPGLTQSASGTFAPPRTALDAEVSASYLVRYGELGNRMWHAEVLAADGRLLADGLGTDPVDCLLELIRDMLPAGHPDARDDDPDAAPPPSGDR